MTRSLAHVSGGVDSAAVAAQAVARGTLRAGLFVDYGQPYAESVPYQKIESLVREVKPELLENLEYVTTYRGKPREWVPQRNLVIGALSIHVATTLRCNLVLVGSTADDHFGDNRMAFWLALGRAAQAGAEEGTPEIRFEAPLQHANKQVAVDIVRAAGLELERLWWCYQNRARPCGRCRHCVQVKVCAG